MHAKYACIAGYVFRVEYVLSSLSLSDKTQDETGLHVEQSLKHVVTYSLITLR